MPKSGCTSIKNLMYFLDSGVFLQDPLTIHGRRDLLVRPHSAGEALFSRLKTDVVFTFVRHPLRRAYSCFNEKVHFEHRYSFPKVRDMLIERYGCCFDGNVALEDHRRNFLGFLRFAEDTFKGENGFRRDAHWNPQTFMVNTATKHRMIDFIGRVENFEAHLACVLQMVGAKLETTMPRMNEGPPPPYRYEDIIDDEVTARGARLYRADFKNFGYEI